MASSNYLEVSAALTAVMKLVNADTAPAILDNLMPLFQHPKYATCLVLATCLALASCLPP